MVAGVLALGGSGRRGGCRVGLLAGGLVATSPVARRKAQRLKSIIVDALGDLQTDFDPRHVPFVQHCIFLHAPSCRCALPPCDATDLSGLDGLEPRSGLQASLSGDLLP